eukprot:1161833-Pelagomonas_calceolata.AAC.19
MSLCLWLNPHKAARQVCVSNIHDESSGSDELAITQTWCIFEWCDKRKKQELFPHLPCPVPVVISMPYGGMAIHSNALVWKVRNPWCCSSTDNSCLKAVFAVWRMFLLCGEFFAVWRAVWRHGVPACAVKFLRKQGSPYVLCQTCVYIPSSSFTTVPAA